MIELPAHWNELTLKELVITRKGKKPLKLSNNFFSGSIPYLDIDAIENSNIKQYADNLTTLVSNENDIFIVADGSRSGLVTRGMVGAVGSTILCITPFAIDVDYLYFYLKSKFEFLNKNTTGASIPHLNQSLFLNLKIPIPPPNEQKLIAEGLKNKLEEYQRDFKDAENELIEVKRYRRSVLQKAVAGELTEKWRNKNNVSIDSTIEELISLNSEANIYEKNIFRYVLPSSWVLTDAKSICKKITDGEHNTPQRFQTGELLLSARNVRDGYIDYSNVDYISREDLYRLRMRCDPERNDVLIVSVGATIGRTSIVSEDILFALVRSVLLLKPIISGEYLMYCLQSPVLQDVIRENSKGVAQAHLYITETNLLPIPFPSLEERKEIVKQIKIHFDTANQIEEKTSVTIKRIDDLQRAIFQMAFSGKLYDNVKLQTDEEWFKKFLDLNNAERISKKDIMTASTNAKKIDSKKLRDTMSLKKSIIEILDSAPENVISVEEAWHQSHHYEKGNIENFYEELEESCRKNKSGKLVKWEFSDDRKSKVILKFE